MNRRIVNLMRKDCGRLNQSTYILLRDSFRHLTRIGLLRAKTRLNCTRHGIQTVVDLFPNQQVLLACNCRRDWAYRKQADIEAFEEAKIERKNTRLSGIQGSTLVRQIVEEE